MKSQFKPLRVAGLAACLIALLAATPSGREFRIDFIQLEPDHARLEFPSDVQSYFILFRGNTVEQIDLPVDMALGIEGPGALIDPDPPPRQAFYRVLRVPLNAPRDTDGDGIDDVWELLHRLPGAALNPNDAHEDHTGSGRPDIEDYLEGLPLTAWFDTAESSALSYGGTHLVTVRFTRPVTGVFAYEVGGDAIAGTDFQPLSGELHLAESPSVIIPIQLQPGPSLRGPRSIVLTLKRPGDHVTSRIDATPSEGRADRFSSHVVTIRDADHGLYRGSLTFLSETTRTEENGETQVTIVPAPPISPSTLQIALRSGPGGSHAVVEMRESLLFAEPLSIPVSLSDTVPGFASPGAVDGTTTFRELQGRTVAWQFEFTSLTFTGDGQILEAECRITLDGLTASGIPQILNGTLFASRLHP